MALRIRDALTQRGWPEPVFADSGNGAHLLYKIDLPADDGGIVERILQQLDAEFSTPAVVVDKKTFNPARIWKLYGSLACKGDNTPERPHRPSSVLSAPEVVEVVSRDLLLQLAGTPKPVKQPQNGKFDLDAFIARHFPDAKEKPWKDGRIWVLPTCPWDVAHNNGAAFITQADDGAIGAGCHHNGCAGNDWHALREKLEGPRIKPQQRKGSRPVAQPEPETVDRADPLALARKFVAENFGHHDHARIIHVADEFHTFNGTRWQCEENAAVRQKIYHWLEPLQISAKDTVVPFKPTRRDVDSVVDALRAVSYRTAKPPCWLSGDGPDPTRVIVAPNGVF